MAKQILYTLLVFGLTSILGFSQTILTPGSSKVLSESICEGDKIATITFTPANGGTGTNAYQWQYLTSTIRTWTNIVNEIGLSYTPLKIGSTTQFRRVVTNGTQTAVTEVYTVIVLPPFTHANNTITAEGNSYCGSQVYISGSDIYQLENLTNTNYNISYNWLSSSNKNGPWTSLGYPELSYSVSGIRSTTYYRRTVSSNGRCNVDTSDVVEIKIGNPLVVTSTDDNTDVVVCGMLRYAINYANDNIGVVDVITFDLPKPSSISLETSIFVSQNLTLKGPGKDNLILTSRNSIFNFACPNCRLEAIGDTTSISGMAFVGASASALNFNSAPSSLVLKNCDFKQNTTSLNGAGLNFNGVNLLIDTCTFSDNVSGTGQRGGNGAGVYINSNKGNVKILNSSFLSNTGTSSQTGIGDGQGIYLAGAGTTASIENTSFYKNTSSNGGGLCFDPNFNTSANIINSTFSGNIALYGGAVHSAGKVALFNTTITENEAIYGGGLAIYSGASTLKNTIIAQNKGSKGSPDVYISVGGILISNGNNFIGVSDDTNGDPVWDANSDIRGFLQNPRIPKLTTLNTTNLTYSPLLGSPVIDKGATYSGSPDFDQLGAKRALGNGIDIGSVEFVPFAFSAGKETSTCDSIINLNATAIPTGYIGAWGTIAADKGKANITNTAIAITTAKILKSDTVRFVWSLLDQANNVLLRDTVRVIRKAIPAKPTVVSPVNVCLNAVSPPLTPNGASFKWYTVLNGGTALPNLYSPLTLAAGSTSYFVSQTTNGCEGLRSQVNVIVQNLPATPIASASSPAICAGSPFGLFASTINGATYSWTGPLQFTSQLQNPAIGTAPLGASGIYNVVAISALGCRSVPGAVNMTVLSVPAQPSEIVGITTLCTGDSAIYSVTPVAGLNYTWVYSGFNGTIVGNGNSIKLKTTAITTTGNLQVAAIANACTSQMRTLSIRINTTPNSPTINPDIISCVNKSVQLTSSTSITGATYNWIGPNGFVSTLQNPTINSLTANSAGTYSATVTVNGCTSKPSTTIITAKPLPAIVGSKRNIAVCAGDSIFFKASTVANGTYSWSGGQQFFSALQNPKVGKATIGFSGRYFVTYSLNGCDGARDTVDVVVNALPAATLSYSKTAYCVSEPNAKPTALDTKLSNKFSVIPTGLKLNGTTGEIDFSTSTPASYTIIDTVTNTAGCKNVASFRLAVNEEPATPIITGACVTPVPPATLSTQYANEVFDTRWLRNDTLINISRTYVASAIGIYKAIAIVKATGCASDTSAGIDPFITTPKISIVGSSTFCAGDSLKVSSSSVNGNVWKLGTSTIPSAQNIVIKSAGKLILQVTGGNCPGKDSVIISTNPSPAIPVITSIVDSACAGGFVKLSTVSNAGLQWILNGFPIRDSTKASLQATTSGSYQVQAKLGTCSSISEIKKIGFKPLPAKPILSLAGKRTLCEGDSLPVSILNYGTANGVDTWFLNGKSITGTNSLKLKTAGVYNIVRTNKGCTSNSDTLNLQVSFCSVTAFAGNDASICTDSYRLAASQASGYQTAWRVLKGKATFADSSANTTATKLASGLNTFVWVLKTNNKVVGSDTVNVINNAVSKADAGSFINTCNSSSTLKAVEVLKDEIGKWKSLGRAKVTDSTLFNTPVTNLAPYDSVNKSNKFVWTISKGNCVSKDTAEVYYSIVVITVKDVKSGFAGETIKVPVLVNDKYSLGDKLTVNSDWKKVKALDTAFVIKDTVYFKTNAKEYLKNYSFSYFLSNQCPTARDTGIVVLNSINIKPVPVPAQNVVLLAGTTKIIKIPTKYYDANPNIDSLSLVLNQNSKGLLGLSFSSDSIAFTLDYTSNPTYSGTDIILFRVWDKDEKGIRNSAIDTLLVTVTNKLAYAGADKTICADTITLSAAAVSGYTGSWTSLNSNPKFANSTLPNTKVIGLAQDTNKLVWTLRRNGQDVGKDTVFIVSLPRPKSVIPTFKPSCASNATITIPLVANETISFNSVGMAKIQPTTSPKDSYLLSELQNFPTVNKFVWTLRLGSCTIKDTLKYYFANNIITVKDTIESLAGDTIKVFVSKVAENDLFSRGDIFDSLIVQGINSSNSSIILSKFQKSDTSFYFVTNKRIIKKETYSYRLRNTCGVLSNVATLLISARNSPPKTFSQNYVLGNVKIHKVSFPIIQLDSNRYIQNIEPVKLPAGISASYEYDSVLNVVTFTIDASNAQISNTIQTVQFRIFDGFEEGFLTFNLEPTTSQDIEVYNALSPNGDGKHDFLEIKNIELAKKNTINIFNRWGDNVYTAEDYDNKTVVFDGGTLPDGTYYYVFEPEGDKKILKGFILLKR